MPVGRVYRRPSSSALTANFCRLRGKREHVSPHRPLDPLGPLGRVELTFRVDQPLEPRPKATMCRPDHDLRVQSGPCGQPADPTVEFAGGCIVHRDKDETTKTSASVSFRQLASISRWRGRPVAYLEMLHRTLKLAH